MSQSRQSDSVDWPALILKADRASDPERALATLANMASREVEGRVERPKGRCVGCRSTDYPVCRGCGADLS